MRERPSIRLVYRKKTIQNQNPSDLYVVFVNRLFLYAHTVQVCRSAIQFNTALTNDDFFSLFSAFFQREVVIISVS